MRSPSGVRCSLALLLLVFAILTQAADECADPTKLEVCTRAGQACEDVDITIANDYQCICRRSLGYVTPATGIASPAVGCVRKNSCADVNNANTCLAKNQACVHLDGWTTFQCVCIPPFYCESTAGAASQDVFLDECAVVCDHCADTGVGTGNVCWEQGQRCHDPDTLSASSSDWRCLCAYPNTGDRGGSPATCIAPTDSECQAVTTCTVATKQFCQDFTLTMIADDFVCSCLPPYSGPPGRAKAADPCELDECTARCPTCADRGGNGTAGGNICERYGQVCEDKNKRTLGSWVCQCPPPSSLTAGQDLAACTGGGECIAKRNACGAGQYCYDPTTAGPDNDWLCVCLAPFMGSPATTQPATCLLNECASDCPSCGSLVCQKNGQNCTEGSQSIFNDWSCVCLPPTTGAPAALQPAVCSAATGFCSAGFPQCQVYGQQCVENATEFSCACIEPYVGAVGNPRASCVFDECVLFSSICIDEGQTCVDPDTSVRDNWECHCACEGCVGYAWKMPATCVLSECYSVCPTCAQTSNVGIHACFAHGQGCAESDTSATATSDWKCLCAGDSTVRGLEQLAVTADCGRSPLSECIRYSAFCAASHQSCADPSHSIKNDWRCNCLFADSTQIVAPQSLATCTYDECVLNCATCEMGICTQKGQRCTDPVTTETSLSDWYCECLPSAGSGRAIAKAATCTVHECIMHAETCNSAGQECIDPDPSVANDWYCLCPWALSAVPTPTAIATCAYPAGSDCGQAAKFDTCASVGQACNDTQMFQTAGFSCNCIAPAVGTPVNGQAICTLDECTARCATCADDGAGNICDMWGQSCVDPNQTNTGDWTCVCRLPAQGNATMQLADCSLDECLTNRVCAAGGQTCYDSDLSADALNTWFCFCPGDSGIALGNIAPCSLDECAGNRICADAGQSCTDPNTDGNSTGDWVCTCSGSATGSAPVEPATCVYEPGSICTSSGLHDTCISAGQACSSVFPYAQGSATCVCVFPEVGTPAAMKRANCSIPPEDECLKFPGLCGSTQRCFDPDWLQVGDVGCLCPAGGDVQVASQWASCIATPTIDECTETCDSCADSGSGNICTQSGQTCDDQDPTTGLTWACTCPTTGLRVPLGLAECAVNECVNALCPADQTCLDPNTSQLSTNDWMCVCENVGVSKVGGAAVCDECLLTPCIFAEQSCNDPQPLDSIKGDFTCTCPNSIVAVGLSAICFDECAVGGVCGFSQDCVDPDTSVNSKGDFVCVCPNTKANKTGGVSSCNECRKEPCGAGQACADPNPDDLSANDFVCSCIVGGGSNTGAPALSCASPDECQTSPCGDGQTCDDANQQNTNDYVCTCALDGSKAIGRPASPCGSYLNECVCASDCCPLGQTCADPTPLKNSMFDYTCTCDGSGISRENGPVLDCVLPGTLAPEIVPSLQHYFFRFQTRMNKVDYDPDEMIAAIARIINLAPDGTEDTSVTQCQLCSWCRVENVKRHCFTWVGDNPSSCGGFTSFLHRQGTALQTTVSPTGEGVFELLGNVTEEREAWMRALLADTQDLIDHNAVQMVDGSFIFQNAITPPPNDEDDDTFPWWMYIVLGLVLVTCLAVLIMICCRRRKNTGNKKKNTSAERKDTEAPQEMTNIAAVAAHGEGERGRGKSAAREASSHGSISEDTRTRQHFPRPGGSRDRNVSMNSAGYHASRENPIMQVFPGTHDVPVTTANQVGPSAVAGAGAVAGTAAFGAYNATREDPPIETVVIGFGRNLEGQLGIGAAEDMQMRYSPVEVPDMNGVGIHFLCCGSFHTMVVTTDASVLAFGEGTDGQLGLGNTLSPKHPTPVPFFQGKIPRKLACGEQHTVVACYDNVYVFGSGQDGQLGLGDNENRLLPTAIPFFAGRGAQVEQIACGSHHTCVILSGVLYGMGWNYHGQLGLGDDIDRLEPTELTFFRDKLIASVTCGVQHTVVLCEDGLYVMGGNSFGQLGLGHQMNQFLPQHLTFFDGLPIKGIDAWFHTIVACEGTIYAFGEGQHGKLGIAPRTPDKQHTDVFVPLPVDFFTGRDVLSVHACSEHTAILCTEGLYIWGNGSSGKLGHGDSESIMSPADSLLECLQPYTVHLVAMGLDHSVIYATPR
ncbi:hypothetical protein DIPPA_29350 [Diplonema papillatum]|nr:hypothetical protein DIPPA_29350 [Diplonema papillatum]